MKVGGRLPRGKKPHSTVQRRLGVTLKIIERRGPKVVERHLDDVIIPRAKLFGLWDSESHVNRTHLIPRITHRVAKNPGRRHYHADASGPPLPFEIRKSTTSPDALDSEEWWCRSFAQRPNCSSSFSSSSLLPLARHAFNQVGGRRPGLAAARD